MERVRSGERSFVRLDVLHLENLRDSLRNAGIDQGRITDDKLLDLNMAWHRLDPWPDSVEGLNLLSARFVIAPVSNGHISLLNHMVKREGLPWVCLLGVRVVRCPKPDPTCYYDFGDVYSGD